MTLPKSISIEKQQTMRQFGVDILPCDLVPFTDPNHYYHQAKRIADATPNAFWTNQFENVANFRAHFESTAPEIAQQAAAMGYTRIDGVALGAGTGGTIAGVSTYLRLRNPHLQTVLLDLAGSNLYDFVTRGEWKAPAVTAATASSTPSSSSVQLQQQQDFTKSTQVYEGIGIARLTANFSIAMGLSTAPSQAPGEAPMRTVTDAMRVTDREGVEMCYYLMRNEGIWIGPSAALNVVGAVKLARKLKAQDQSTGAPVVVTVLCDSGGKYTNTVFNRAWLKEKNLEPQSTGRGLDFVL